MIAPSTVAAEAFVRSRDGRSILDRPEQGTEPLKAFAPDPDRVHAAVTGLEKHGLTVDAVDRVAVAFHGPPEAFTTAFGVKLDYTDLPRGVGHPVWQVAGSAGSITFDVTAGTPLGGVLHAVLLRLPTSPATSPRKPGLFEDDGPQARPQDLLLGEIGQTLRTGFPDDLTRASFPATTPDDALTETGASLQDWHNDPFRRALENHIAGLRRLATRRPRRDDTAEPPARSGHDDEWRPLRAVIVEQSAPPGLDKVWRTLYPGTTGSARRPELAGRLAEIPDIMSWVPNDELRRQVEVFFNRVSPAWRTARAASTEFGTKMTQLSRQAPDANGAGLVADLQAGWKGIRGKGLHSKLAELAAALESSKFDSPKVTGLSPLLVEFNSAMESNAADPKSVGIVIQKWREINRWAANLRTWSSMAETNYLLFIKSKLDAAKKHSAMVSFAFLAVTLDVVNVTLQSAPAADRPTRFWAEVSPVPRRTIHSGSFGRHQPGIITPESMKRECASAVARLADPAMRLHLQVIAVGNNTEGVTDAPPDAPSLDAVLAADAGNVIVVGGCGPAGGAWVATRSTHGYLFDLGAALPGSIAEYKVPLPHICATTWSATGGAVAHPDPTAAERWGLGSGSSLSTPIVAAVCSLVWSACPRLTAAEVKSAVVGAAQRLGGGTFHLPTVGNAHVTARPIGSTGRVVLKEALHAAMLMSGAELAEPLRRLLAPPNRTRSVRS